MMRKTMMKWISILLACTLSLLPAVQSLAKSTDVSDGAIVYPGDSLTGIEEGTTVKKDGETVDVKGGSWSNSSDTAYKVSEKDGNIELTAAAYKLTVKNGSSSGSDALSGGGATCYPGGSTVTITADSPEEGSVFAGWTGDVSFEDASSSETTFSMPDEAVTVTATYQDEEEAEEPEDGEEDEEPEDGEKGEEPEDAESVAEQPAAEEPAADDAAVIVIEEPAPEEEKSTGEEAVSDDSSGMIVTVSDEAVLDENGNLLSMNPNVAAASAEETETESETETETETETESETETETESEETAETESETETETESEETAETESETEAEEEEPVALAAAVDEESETEEEEPVEVAAAVDEESEMESSEEEQSVSDEIETEIAAAIGEENETETAENVPVVLSASYSVTVENGEILPDETDTGIYSSGDLVQIKAEKAPDGKKFSGWTAVVTDKDGQASAETVAFSDASSSQTSFIMPADDVVVTAVYVRTYEVRVSNGLINDTSNYRECEYGEEITITANKIDGHDFKEWKVKADGDFELGDEEAKKETISVTVTQDLEFMALYEGKEYTITVNGGSADYSKAVEGMTVTLEAEEPDAGMAFDYWDVDYGNVKLANASNSITTFTMPDEDVSVTAVYKRVQYSVTVENGSANATWFEAGETVTVISDYPATNKEFNTWSAVSGNVTFADASRATTTFAMPASDVVVEASYKDGPTNYIDGIEEGGVYSTNEKLTFTPYGGGLSNNNPNPGDYRFYPTSYQIGNVSNSWSEAPYTTSMSIKKAGDYTLKVTFTKQVWNGSAWVEDGSTDVQTVSFRIVEGGAVQTGDTTPIGLIAGIAAAACVILIILLVVFIRRRRTANK